MQIVLIELINLISPNNILINLARLLGAYAN